MVVRRLQLGVKRLLSRRAAAPALAVRSNLVRGAGEALPYRARRALLSQGELAFYAVLRAAVEGRFGIGIKPRLADVLEVPGHQWRTRHGGRVAQRHVDFVLYDLATTEVMLVIELDDRSHRRERTKERDAFVDQALAAAGVVVLHVKAARAYDALELLTEVEAHATSRRHLRAAPVVSRARHSIPPE